MTAHTKYPNSPETDKLTEVWHVVTLDDGTTRELLAKHPLDAIERVRSESNKPIQPTK